MNVQREVLLATKETGERARFLLEVFQEGEHWTSTPTPRPSSQMAPLSESPGTATPCAKTWHPRRASAGGMAGVPLEGEKLVRPAGENG